MFPSYCQTFLLFICVTFFTLLAFKNNFQQSFSLLQKEVDSFTAGTQTRASRTRESSVTHKSAITDGAVEENHVIDWNKAKVVDREAQRQTRW